MKIYCSGIGGIGLSAYAALQKAAGHTVMGSDRNDSALLEDLRGQGIEIILSQDGTGLPKDADLFVYSEAITPNAPERRLAQEYGIQSQSYFKALGELSRPYDVIAVCGTHGKSSTTAMTAKLLIEAGLDPTVVVGTKVRELDGRNFRVGRSRWFVLEACEYRRSFHYLSPTIALVTNVDGDHFDAYADLKEYQQAFIDFLQKLPLDGRIIAHVDDKDSRRVAAGGGRRTVNADTQPLITLKTPGRHMQANAQLVLALAEEIGIPASQAKTIVSGFAGTWRRMEEKGTRSDGITVVDDYAHHPVEIKASLQGLRQQYVGRRLVVIFQPHTHDRTLKLYDEFLTAFKEADLVLVTDIYAARSESDSAKADPVKLTADLAAGSGVEAIYSGSLTETEKRLREEILKPGDAVVCMGAGDVTKLSDSLLIV